MPTIARSLAALTLFVGSAFSMAQGAVAQNSTPCMTQSECDLREDLRDTAARHAEYARNVRNQEEAHAAAMQARNEARARVAGNKEAKLEAILQHRRDAYARVRN
jgi:hypothetical protein